MSGTVAAEILARSGEGWKSGPIGLATILVLCVAVYFLFKSMSKHLRKVREEFPTDERLADAERRDAVGDEQVDPHGAAADEERPTPAG